MNDTLKDFRVEVAQNRPRMALQELIPILEDLQNEVQHLRVKVQLLEKEKNPTVKKPPVKKTAAKQVSKTKN